MKNEKKALVPALRFPEFRDAGEWKILQIETVLSVRNDKRLPSHDLPLFSLTIEKGVTAKSGRYNRKFLVRDQKAKRYKLVLPGDVVYNPSNLRWGAINKSKVDYPVVVSPIYEVLYLTDARAIDETFIATALMRPQQIARFITKGQGTLVERIAVKIEDFLDTAIEVPESLHEQQKIADCLSSLDDLIAAHTEKLDALKTHKKGLMQQLFPREGETVPRLRFAEFRDAGEWEPRRLSKFIEERNQYPKGKLPLYSLTIEAGIAPKTERYERSFLVKNEEDAYKLVRPDDFAYNPMNLRFGAIARHSGSDEVVVSKYYNIFYCDSSVDSRFCEIFFKSPGMIAYYDDVATGSLIEKRRVHFSEFLKFDIRFPQLEEQRKIADCLSSLDTLIAAHTEKLDALKTHKKGLMQQLFPSPEETDI